MGIKNGALISYGEVLRSRGNWEDNLRLLNEVLIDLGADCSYKNYDNLASYIAVNQSNIFDVFLKEGECLLATTNKLSDDRLGGYVLLPTPHPLFGKDCKYMNHVIDVPDRITFAKATLFNTRVYWVLGFDIKSACSGGRGLKAGQEKTRLLFKQLRKIESRLGGVSEIL